MTYEEQQQYDKLSADLKEDYNYLKKKHPNWSHEQIMGKLSIDKKLEVWMNTGDLDVTKKGPDGEIEVPPEIMKEILDGAKSVLTGLGIIIVGFFEAVDKALCVLDSIITSGVKYIGNKLKEFWNWFIN